MSSCAYCGKPEPDFKIFSIETSATVQVPVVYCPACGRRLKNCQNCGDYDLCGSLHKGDGHWCKYWCKEEK